MAQNRICKICGKKIEYEVGDGPGRRSYCSDVCAKRAASLRNTENRRACNLQARLGLSGGAIGEINEQVVAIDLVKNGWYVYRAFEPTHPFDILAIKGGLIVKVEVKTETVLPSGSAFLATKKSQDKKHDVLAKVRNLSEITYEPPLPI